MPVFAYPLFTVSSSKQSYLFNQSDFDNQFDAKQSLILPLCHDSEWHNNAIDEYLSSNVITPRSYLSTQVKHIFNKPFCFFTDYAISESGHSDLLPMRYEFVVQDYLSQFGIESKVTIDESDNKLPNLDLWLYSFFGIVDITLLAKLDTTISNCIKQGLANNHISHEKRITTKWNKPVSFPIIIKLADINGNYHSYRLRMSFIDIGALHGNKGYKIVCENVGIDTSVKSLMDKYKSDMLTGLKLYPQEYIAYANGDLNIYDVLVAYNDLMKTVYDDLNLTTYFQLPKLTIGSTVADIVSAAIFNWQGLQPSVYQEPKAKKKVLVEAMGLASADYLRTQVINSHTYLVGKIHGGRCHNNMPLMRYCEDALADYDIAGAYSSIMQQLPFFIGKPWFYDSAKESNEVVLKEFLRCHESDFDKWHYTIYVSTKEPLEYEQDFLVSWLNASSSKVKSKDDKGNITYIPIAEYKSGDCRIYKNEVVNTPITSDTVKWIRSLSKPARNDLMNKLIVKSAIGYKRKDKGKDWHSINLGELLINKLKEKRAHYKRLFKKGKNNRFNSMQELFKLVINTVYGVMCSRHFVTSNVVVANCITQAIRLGMYLMEKGLNLQGSITDGCMGSLNKVVYPLDDRSVYINNLTSLYLSDKRELNRELHIRLGSLDNAKHIALTWDELANPLDKLTHLPCLTIDYGHRIETIKDELIDGIRYNNVNQWIDDKSWLHLNKLFPDFEYLFSFLKIETKDVFNSYVYHGAANYELINPNYSKYAMRGYTGKKGVSIAVELDDNDGLIRLDDYDDSSIPKEFLSQLHTGKIEKLPVFVKTKILKSKVFKEYNFIERSDLQPGDDTIEVGLPNYCSLSQFTFKTIKQHEKWVWAFSRLKRKYQESFEVFFTDKNNVLNYDLMVSELCKMVNLGCHTPIKELSNKYKITPTLKRAATKLLAAKLRNDLTFTKIANEENYSELVD